MTTPRRTMKTPRVKINVTQEHIDKSKPRNSGHCMIADALKDAVPNASFVSVDLATIRFSDPAAGWRYIYLTPRVAQEALLKFDQGEAVEPFSVQLKAAQALPTGNGRKRQTMKQEGGSNTVPTKVGGDSPPTGPLSNGGTGRASASNIGRRREFGLRAYIR